MTYAFLSNAINEINGIRCIDDMSCEKELMVGSKCVNHSCTNPFEQGCLRRYLGENVFPKKRTCNSHDRPDSSKDGICDNALFEDYEEIRILGQNWDPPMVASK